MDTMTQTDRNATWRTDARSCALHAFRITGNHGTKPSTSTVTFPAIAPTRRGAPPL